MKKLNTINIRIVDQVLNQKYNPIICEKAINHIKNNIKTELRPSKINGVGVFAIKDIKAGENVMPLWTGPTTIYAVPIEEFNLFDLNLKIMINKYFSSDIKEYKFIRLTNNLNFIFTSLTFNNSCYPNNNNQNINNNSIAIKDIKKGEELLNNYNL